jgi:photosystem II stability/assembly factor-like uncharacterized protein
MDFSKAKQVITFLFCALLLVATLSIFGLGAKGCIPRIDSLSQRNASPGKIITIQGAFFGANIEANRVFLDGTHEMELIKASASSIDFMAPAMTPGNYGLTVKTTAGTSNQVSFTIEEPAPAQAGESSATSSGFDLYTESLLLNFFLLMVRSDYHREALQSLEALEQAFSGLSIPSELADELYSIFDQSGFYDAMTTIYDWFTGNGLDLVQTREHINTGASLFLEYARVLSREGYGQSLLNLLTKSSSDLRRVADHMPTLGDAEKPRAWLENLPDYTQPGVSYMARGVGLDPIVGGRWDSGIFSVSVYVYLERQGVNPWQIGYANRVIQLDPEYIMGPGEPMVVECDFTVPEEASLGDFLSYEVHVMDLNANQGDVVTGEREIGKYYYSPIIGDPVLEHDHFDNATQLLNTQMAFEWNDWNSDLATFNCQFSGDGVKDKGVISAPVSQLGISQENSLNLEPQVYYSNDAGFYDIEVLNDQVAWVSGYDYILKTEDGGIAWGIKYNGGSKALSAVNEQVIWATGSGGGTNTVMKSTNGGETWNTYNTGINITYREDIYAVNDQVAWVVGTDGSIIKTTNGGVTWTRQNSGTTEIIFSVSALNDQVAWAVGTGGIILKTINGGATWTHQNSGTTKKLTGIAIVNQQVVWVVGAGTILKTTNGGTSWSSQNAGTSSLLCEVSALDENKALAVGYGNTVRYTSDGGVNWLSYNTSNSHNIWGCVLLDDYRAWVVGSQYYNSSYRAFVLKTMGPWSLQSDLDAYLYDIHAINDQVAWAVGSNGAIFKTIDGGSNWASQNSGTTNVLTCVSAVNDQVAWAVGWGGIILKTNNGGITWTNQRGGSYSWDLKAVHAVDTSTAWVVGEGGRILRTTNGGSSWSYQSSGVSSDLYDISAVNSQVAWISGYSSDNTGVTLKTTDGGAHWLHQNPGLGDKYRLRIDAVNENVVWAAYYTLNPFSRSVIRSDDGGDTWQIVHPGYDDINYACLDISAASDKEAWVVGDRTTILYTKDGGKSWIPQGWSNISGYHYFHTIDAVNSTTAFTFDSYASIYKIGDQGGLASPTLRNILGNNPGTILSFTDSYWVTMRCWLTDSKGLESDSREVRFYINGGDDPSIFSFTVGDSVADGLTDDQFMVYINTWSDWHYTPEGSSKTFYAYIGDIEPGQTVCVVDVQCTLSNGPDGSCFVQLHDGATFEGGGDYMEFDLDRPSGQTVHLRIIPPEYQPPPPG